MSVADTNQTRVTGDSPAPDPGPADTRPSVPDPTPAAGASAIYLPGYVVMERLGGGSMGVVYKARHLQLNRTVAVKVIRSGAEASTSELVRFLTEAEAAARVHHPNVVQVFEVGEANGQPFLCLEYVDGQTLADALDGTPWAAPRAAKLVETLARAIGEAHRLGIVHRDLKPANVLVAADGTPKVTDFGLAKMVASDSGVTQSGAFVGTPSYAAPEQAGGGQVGPPADLYALGAVLYELLTGRPPFKAATLVETIRQLASQEPVSVRLLNPAVHPDLEAITLKCLEKNPARRYQSADELADDLGRWQRHEPTRARPPGAVGRAVRWCRRYPAAVAVAGVILLALLGVGWQWWDAVQARGLADDRRVRAERAEELAEARRLDAERAKATAEEDARVAQEVADYLGGLFEEADPFVISGRLLDPNANPNPTAADVVNRGAKRLADPDFLTARPLVRANLLDRLGRVYVGLGEGAKAFPLLAEALELRRKHLPPDHPDLAASLHSVGFLHFARWDYSAARELFTEAMTIRAKLYGDTSPPAVSSRAYLSAVLVAEFDPDSEPLLNRVLAEMKANRPPAGGDPRAVAQADFERCIVLLLSVMHHSRRGENFKAGLAMGGLASIAKTIPDKDLSAVFPQAVEYELFRAANKWLDAVAAGQKLLALLERRLGRSHFLYLRFRLAYGDTLLYHWNEPEKTGETLQETIAGFERAVGGGGGLAEAYWHYGQWVRRNAVWAELDREKKKPHCQRALSYLRRAINEARACRNARQVADYTSELGHFYREGVPDPDLPAAERAFRDALDNYRTLKDVQWNITRVRGDLILTVTDQRKLDDVEALMKGFRSEGKPVPWHDHHPALFRDVARVLANSQRPDAALLYLDEAAYVRPGILDEVDNDPQFADLRQTDRYKKLREGTKSPKR